MKRIGPYQPLVRSCQTPHSLRSRTGFKDASNASEQWCRRRHLPSAPRRHCVISAKLCKGPFADEGIESEKGEMTLPTSSTHPDYSKGVCGPSTYRYFLVLEAQTSQMLLLKAEVCKAICSLYFKIRSFKTCICGGLGLMELVNALLASSMPRTHVGLHACNPSSGEVEAGGSFRLASLVYWQSVRPRRDPCLQGGGQLS